MADDVSSGKKRRIQFAQTVRVVVVGAIAAILVVLALANTDDVEIDWLVDSTTGPLVIIIGVSAALGFLAGLIVAWRRST